MVQLTVGTGGSTYGDEPDPAWSPNLEASQHTSFGVLRMEPLDGGYGFAFVTAEGEEPYTDEGHGDCA
jgi:hypothetical protein